MLHKVIFQDVPSIVLGVCLLRLVRFVRLIFPILSIFYSLFMLIYSTYLIPLFAIVSFYAMLSSISNHPLDI